VLLVHLADKVRILATKKKWRECERKAETGCGNLFDDVRIVSAITVNICAGDIFGSAVIATLTCTKFSLEK